MKKVKRAWIFYWDFEGLENGLNVAADGEVVAILPANYSQDRVCFLLQRLFAERVHTASELLHGRSKHLEEAFNPRRIHGVPNTGVEYVMGYYSGVTPKLFAKLVYNLTEIDETTISWEEIDWPHKKWMCEIAKVEDCPDEKRGPKITIKRGFTR